MRKSWMNRGKKRKGGRRKILKGRKKRRKIGRGE